MYCSNVLSDVIVVIPITPMLRAQHGMWYDSTCRDEQCLIYISAPRVVPGSDDRNVYIFFHVAASGKSSPLHSISSPHILTVLDEIHIHNH